MSNQRHSLRVARIYINIIIVKEKPKCGTLSGYRRHIKLKVPSCDECRAANAEKQRSYYKNNKEKIYKINRSWDARNKNKKREYSRNATARRKARKLNSKRELYTIREIIKIYGTDCYICKEPIDLLAPRKAPSKGWQLGLQIDHVIPLSKGGDDTLKNVRPAHTVCNIRKKDK